MPTRTSVIPVVTLCDSQGALIWTSHPNPAYKPGVLVWEYIAEEDRELVKDQISRAAFLKEPQEFEVSTDHGEHFHVWAWPMMVEKLSVCLIGVKIPDEISLLTTRERECLQRLATGRSTAEIAAEFDVSMSTVHTYMKRAREKLGLPTMEQLIAYASRYLPPPASRDKPSKG